MALVSKILETTLTAGSTAVTFTDSDIPNSLIRVFSSNSDVIPESRMLSGNTLTVTYAPQNSNMDVALEIVKQGLDIVDNVLSEDTDKALSAKQGYLLSAAIGDINDRLDGLVIPEKITDLDDVTVTDIQSGQVLSWDGEEFINVNLPGSNMGVIDYTNNIYSTTYTSSASDFSYTATEDCYIIFNIINSANNSAYAVVKNASDVTLSTIADQYIGTLCQHMYCRYLPKGLKVQIHNSHNGGSMSFKAFGIM